MRRHPRLLTAAACAAAWLTASAGLWSQTTRSVWDGVYTAEQATRGAAVYTRECARCHGPTLQGADAPPLAGVEFSGNWNGLALSDLSDRIRTAMPPDSPGKLTAQERADVIARILSAGQFPAGEAELPRDASGLAQIQFLASRP